MDVGLELLQPLLVDDAEALFFIADDEAELFELDRFGDHRMGAPDDVDRAVGKAVASLLRLGVGNEARPAADVDGRSVEHPYDHQSLKRIPYAVFCLQFKIQ